MTRRRGGGGGRARVGWIGVGLWAGVVSGPVALLAQDALAQDAPAGVLGPPAPADGLPSTMGTVLVVPGETFGVVTVSTLQRHVTVIVLPVTETIVDAVVGDAERWQLTSAANLAFIKPLEAGVVSNVALICDTGNMYSFRVVETELTPPRLVVRVKETPAAAARGQPVFVHADAVRVAEAGVAAAEAAIAAAETDAATRVAAGEAAGVEVVDAAREAYPRSLRFVYAWDDDVSGAPFFVDAMWHDGTSTYLRAAPALGTVWVELGERNGPPIEVTHETRADGLWVAPRVLGAGWLQHDDARAVWQRTEREEP